jgi:hypothetical protein
MRASLAVAFALATCASPVASASGDFLEAWLPSFNMELSFGGAQTRPPAVRFSGALAFAGSTVPASAAQLPAYLRVDFDPARGARALVGGVPLVGYRLAVRQAEDSGPPAEEGGWWSEHWLTAVGVGAAAVAAAALLSGGDGDGEGTSSPAEPGSANICAVEGLEDPISGETYPGACAPNPAGG